MGTHWQGASYHNINDARHEKPIELTKGGIYEIYKLIQVARQQLLKFSGNLEMGTVVMEVC